MDNWDGPWDPEDHQTRPDSELDPEPASSRDGDRVIDDEDDDR